jgi:glycerophosphoryl diester phosphodiesterase
MSANTRAPRRKWAIGCLIILIALPLLYYGGQAALRTPPLTPVQVIAHRGGAKYAPENTLAAFKNAIAQGADWLEFDVQMTRDGALVVIHDETVDRTTNGTGAVGDLSLEQIKALDAGNGEQVPTFEEVVALAKASGTKILPEAKSAHLYPGIEAKMLKVLTDADYLDQTVIQSFEADSLEKLHALNPNVNLCALYGLWKFNVRQPPADAKYICPMGEMVLLNPGMIRQAHSEGRHAFVWFGVLENPLAYKLLRFFGADGLIGNDPLAIKAAVTAR